MTGLPIDLPPPHRSRFGTLLKRAASRGRAAFAQGKPREANPYQQPQLWSAWHNAWADAHLFDKCLEEDGRYENRLVARELKEGKS